MSNVTVINTPVRLYSSCIKRTQAEVFKTNADSYCLYVLVPKTDANTIAMVKEGEKGALAYKKLAITDYRHLLKEPVNTKTGEPYTDERQGHYLLKILDPRKNTNLYRIADGKHANVVGNDNQPVENLDAFYDGCYVKVAFQIAMVYSGEVWRACAYLRKLMFVRDGEVISHYGASPDYFGADTTPVDFAI